MIEAASSIEELEQLIKAPVLVHADPADRESEMIPNPEPHIELLPTIDVSEYLTRADLMTHFPDTPFDGEQVMRPLVRELFAFGLTANPRMSGPTRTTQLPPQARLSIPTR